MMAKIKIEYFSDSMQVVYMNYDSIVITVPQLRKDYAWNLANFKVFHVSWYLCFHLL